MNQSLTYTLNSGDGGVIRMVAMKVKQEKESSTKQSESEKHRRRRCPVCRVDR